MDQGLHLMMKPKELHQTRPEYKEFELEKFRKHIHQEVYTRKAAIQYKWNTDRGDDLGMKFRDRIVEVDDARDDDEDTE